MLVTENDVVAVLVWDRISGRFTQPALPAGKYVAENSELRWSGDGKALAFTLRANEWKTRAQQRFVELTKGPVTVLDGSDDFLEWDDMRRMSDERSIVLWEPGAPQVRTVHAEGRIGSWVLAKDGSAITVQQDITKKTDYDVIFGREFSMVTQSLGGGEALTLFPTLKGFQVQWAEDGTRYVYTREGRVFVGTIADTVRRQLLGPARATGVPSGAAAVPPDTSAAARAQRAKERFSAVRWSPAGDAILASNSEGFWLVDVASGEREMIVPLPDSTSMAPRPALATWSQDGRYLYFNENSRTEWNRSIARYDRQAKALSKRSFRMFTASHQR
jgi:hypothetical protein